VLEAKDMKWNNAVVRWIELDELAKGVTLTIEPAKTLKVTVRDSKGNALKGAEVYASPRWSPFSKSEQTNDDGVAVFKHMFVGGKYSRPHAGLEGYFLPCSSDSLTVGDPEWPDEYEIVMEEARRTQTGRVVDKDGKPVPGVRVRAETGADTVTDSEGRFKLENLPDSEITISARLDSFYGRMRISADTPDVEIKLSGD